jgi:predicted nuclease of restriction endonuclease-like (RecB) superfamily
MLINSDDYFQVLESVKSQIHNARYRAVLGANREQILLYWNIGRIIIENTSYGAKFVENLARDIKAEFPDAKGYSVRNLKYMRKFAALVTDEAKVQTLSALLSWSHNTHLFDRAIAL